MRACRFVYVFVIVFIILIHITVTEFFLRSQASSVHPDRQNYPQAQAHPRHLLWT